MRRIALGIVLTVVATALGVTGAVAQMEVSLGAGINAPRGEYSEEAKLGYAITTGLGYRFFPYLSAGAEVSIFGTTATDEYLDQLGSGWEIRNTILQYAGVAKGLVPLSRHFAYAKASVGNYRGATKVTNPSGTFSGHITDLGFGIGGGFLLSGRENSSFFIEAMLHHVPYKDADYDTQFVSIDAGAVFSFDLFGL